MNDASNGNGNGNDEESWAEGLAEQASALPPSSNPQNKTGARIELLEDIPMELSVEIGRARLTIAQILKLSQGSVVELDVLAGEPLNVYVNQVLIAQGEVVTVNDRFGIRLTDILSNTERARRGARRGS